MAAMNTVGREETAPTMIPDSTTAEPTPCDCYQQKGKIGHTRVSSVSLAKNGDVVKLM